MNLVTSIRFKILAVFLLYILQKANSETAIRTNVLYIFKIHMLCELESV